MTQITKTTPQKCTHCGAEFFPSRDERYRKPPKQERDLSARELQIVRLIQLGQLNKEIAHELRLTEGTVKEYLNRIFRKVDVKNRTELAVWAMTNCITA
jgi:DNA-binding NarL/FixJ family response regulator